MKRLWWIPIALLAAGLAAGEARKGKTGKEIGLVPVDVFDTAVPPAADRTGKDPGEGTPVPRPYPGAPPVISHAVGDFLPITREENACVLCHGDPDSGATLIPESHYVDLRNAPGQKREEIAGTRHVCTTCHVPQTGARLLVPNEFGRTP